MPINHDRNLFLEFLFQHAEVDSNFTYKLKQTELLKANELKVLNLRPKTE